MVATPRPASAGIGVLGEILGRFSDTEKSSYYQAQRDYSDSMEFDAESNITAEEQATLIDLLRNWAAKKPAQIAPAIAEARKRKPVPAVDVDLGHDLADPGSRLRMHKALLANLQACSWLLECGCSQETIVHFSLGLTRGLRTATDALAAPLLHRDGQFYKKYVNTVIPGVTDDHRDKHKRSSVWSAGDALVYYGAEQKNQTRLLVCDNVIELWAIWSAIRGTPIADDLQLVASTNSNETPRIWKKGEFWESWASVYLGHTGGGSSKPDKGDERAKCVARLSDRESLRMKPVGAEDWVGFFRSGKNVKHFEELLSSAWPLSERDLEEQSAIGREQWFSVKSIDITVGVHNGFLFEVIEIGEWVTDPDTREPVQRMRTTVVRSDRTTHSVRAMPAPAGTPAHQVVHRLWPDGTVVPGQLKPRMSPSWRIESIQAFLRGEGRYPPLAEQIAVIIKHLRGSIWLPYEDDYTLLACVVALTYVQSLFESVPLLNATGGKGTGKTALGIAMTGLCANAPDTTIGQISAASIARMIDQTRGFIALDDLESVATRKGGESQFGELVQGLKLSYNQKSAVKWWTNMKTGRLERLNFFGVKLIGNTQGVDAILGSRMFSISTRGMPKNFKLDKSLLLQPPQIPQLRDELHLWAFSNVTDVCDAYALIFPDKSNRDEEIAAPLRVIAHLAGDADLKASLERAFERQKRLDVQPETPEEVLREAMNAIVTESVRESGVLRTVVNLTEVMMRMATMVDANYRKGFTNELSEIESSEWVGRQLRQQHYIDTDVRVPRIELYGKWLRSYRLTDEFIATAIKSVASPDELASLERNEDPKYFCRACAMCPYRNFCEMRTAREEAESHPR